MKQDAPCRGCKDRAAGCHDNCPKYIGFKKERKAEAQKKAKYYSEHNWSAHSQLVHKNLCSRGKSYWS